jgi:hypothetical protein
MTRIGLCAALLAATALTACGGGGGGSSDDGPTSGLPNPGSITGANPDYINSLNSELAIATSNPLVLAGRRDLPLSGNASYTGFGSIFDASLTTADTSADRLRNRSVVTDVTASANFNSQTLTITQDRFRDVDGKLVPGQANWTTSYDGDGLFNATVTGNVDGTSFATGPNQARVAFFGNQASSAITGSFSNAPSTPGGWLQGTRVNGDFAATSD